MLSAAAIFSLVTFDTSIVDSLLCLLLCQVWQDPRREQREEAPQAPRLASCVRYVQLCHQLATLHNLERPRSALNSRSF